MKESLKKFREEAQKLEESDALKAARQKFETVEKEASKGILIAINRIPVYQNTLYTAFPDLSICFTYR